MTPQVRDCQWLSKECSDRPLGMTMASSLVGPDDVAAAREVLRGVLAPTPMLRSRVLSDRLGGPVFLKCENLQRTGSFKARRAFPPVPPRPPPARGPRG